MKFLTLLRHAKSSWDNETASDFDRVLNNRGRRSAPVMGGFIRDNLPAPDYVLCSTAARAQETLELIRPIFSTDPDVEFSRGLYLASPSDIMQHVYKAPKNHTHIIVIAHNPGLHMLALELADPTTSEPKQLTRLAAKFPTAALAHFEFEAGDWESLCGKQGALRIFAMPKELSQSQL